MFVNTKDIENEINTMKLLAGNLPTLSGHIFRRNTDPAAIFDFNGFFHNLHTVCFDVKIRNNRSTDFPTCLISKEKIEHVELHKKLRHYIAYSYLDRKIVVFNLNSVRLTEKNIDFLHKRSGQMVSSHVYMINAADKLKEISY